MAMSGGVRRWAVLIFASSMVVVGCASSPEEASPTTEPSTTTTTEVEPSFATPAVAAIAHRGASGEAPEHTFAAYDLALDQGADYLELDLQLTADGEVVVLHDPTLDRTVRGPADRCSGAVAMRTAADLTSCDAGAWFAEQHPDQAGRFEGEPVPTLAGVLERYGATARYYIELKAPDAQPGLAEGVLELLDEATLAPPDPGLPPVVIQSFSSESLRRIHDRRPDLPLVQLLPAAAEIDDAGLVRIGEYAVAIGPAYVVVDEALVAAANRRCLDVHPYTVNERPDQDRLLEAGVGAMFTDFPERLIEARAAAQPPEAICEPPAAGSRER